MVSKEYSVVENIVSSAVKAVRVPFRVPCGPTFLTAAFGLPRSYSWTQTLPSRADSTRIQDESALTTLTPTPWRPPDTLYPPPPNLPPAWRTVCTTSSASLPVECRPTGTPRPSSSTLSLPSAWMVTRTLVACPAIASSIELSTTSHTRWWSP